MKKICECCGIEYNAKRSSSKYCSKECQIKARTKKVKVQCDYCGKTIEKKSCHMNTKHNFCSKECQGKWSSKHKVGENHPTYSQVETECSYCGKSFMIQPYKLKENQNHYCSRECQHKSLLGRHLSDDHKQKLRDNVPKGKDSPHWKHDKTDEERLNERSYPEYHQWERAVKERDNYTCQCCGKRGGNLNSHHLNGYHWDKDHRHNVDNGITLCVNCHKEFHSIYGNKNNTKEQYKEFVNNKNKSAS